MASSRSHKSLKSNKSHQRTRRAAPVPPPPNPPEPGRPRLLDEETSARVLGEFLALGDVSEREVDAVTSAERGLSAREIAIAFCIADVLQVPDAFEMAPRFRDIFATVRAAAPVRVPPAPTGLVAEALALFAEVTDPAGSWATTEETVDSTVYNMILEKISFGDRERAGRILAAVLEHATDEELRAIVGALKEDLEDAREAQTRDHAIAAGGAR